MFDYIKRGGDFMFIKFNNQIVNVKTINCIELLPKVLDRQVSIRVDYEIRIRLNNGHISEYFTSKDMAVRRFRVLESFFINNLNNDTLGDVCERLKV